MITLRKLATIFVLVFVLTLTLTYIVYAQTPGDLDLTFNNTGIVTYTTGLAVDGGYGVALQEDGKIVTTGCSTTFVNSCDVTVVRFNGDGSLDTDFNGTGVVTTPVTIGINGGTSIIVQPNDGKIVVAGVGIEAQGTYTQPPFPFNDFVLVRYETDGSLDLSLKGTGFLTTSISEWDDWGHAIAVQPNDGKIVVAGEGGGYLDDGYIAVVRYHEDGDLDLDFSDDGIVTTPVGNSSTARSIALQTDGKIVVAGYYQDGDTYFVVARYTVTGTLDAEFNNSGLVTGTIPGRAYGVAIQPDGKIIVAGEGQGAFDTDIAVVRYNDDGTVDTSFGPAGTGIVTTAITSEYDGARAVAIQDDGKIVVAGYSNDTVSYTDFTVVRYTSGGTLDTTFHRTGIVTTPVSGSNMNAALGVVIQPDGNIIAAGATGTSRPVYYSIDFLVVRYIGAYSTYVPVILKKDDEIFATNTIMGN
jgi:uncharacterized delta-60 repeat protein